MLNLSSRSVMASSTTAATLGPVANCLMTVRFASKKAGGSSVNGRDSNPKYLGVKKFGGEVVKPGSIILRQRGTKYHPGDNAMCGRDHTIFSVSHGKVRFQYGKIRKNRQYVHVDPIITDDNVAKLLKGNIKEFVC